MSEKKKEVKLHGMWASPWVRRVTIALKIKGISYEYFEEDLKNKSQLLLKYNPVKKLVPVLVHHGRPIPESLVILEYIDEIWTNSPKLFPFDPYQRAKVRFWANFIDLQIFEKLRDVVKAPNDEEEDKIIKEIQENMNKLEANVKDLHSGGTHVSGESMEILDVLMITLLPIINGVEEAISIKFILPENFHNMRMLHIFSLHFKASRQPQYEVNGIRKITIYSVKDGVYLWNCGLAMVKGATPSHGKMIEFFSSLQTLIPIYRVHCNV